MFEKIKNNLFTFALIVIVIIIILYNVYTNSKIINDQIEGLWIADEDFCNRTQIDGMMLYIGPIESDWSNLSNNKQSHVTLASINPIYSERKAYLIMYSNDSIVANKKFNMVIQNSVIDLLPFIKQNCYKKIQLYDTDESDELSDKLQDEDDISCIPLKKIMPLTQSITINFAEGKMIWENNDVIYGEFYKDNMSSKYGKMA